MFVYHLFIQVSYNEITIMSEQCIIIIEPLHVFVGLRTTKTQTSLHSGQTDQMMMMS